MVRMSTGSLGRGFRHVFAFLRLAVIPAAVAVVDIRRRVDPNHSSTTARSSCHCAHGPGGFGRMRHWSRLWSSGRSWSRRGWRRRCSGHRGSGCRGCRSRCCSVRNEPLLHTLMAAASARLLWSTRKAAVLALSCGPCGRSGWHLSQAELTHPNSQGESDHAALYLHPKPPSIDFGGRACVRTAQHTKTGRKEVSNEFPPNVDILMFGSSGRSTSVPTRRLSPTVTNRDSKGPKESLRTLVGQIECLLRRNSERDSAILRSPFFRGVIRDRVLFAIALCLESRLLDTKLLQLICHQGRAPLR